MSTAATARGDDRVTQYWLPFVAILAAGLVLRLWRLHRQSITMDELAELRIAQLAPAEIVRVGDGFPPLYHLLLHGWLQLTRHDDAARWLAVMLGLATVFVVWRLAAVVADGRAALGAALVAAVSPILVWYSQEGRAYTLYALCAALTLFCTFRVISDGRPREWALYVAAGAVGAYTHYYFAVLLACTALITAIETMRSPDRAQRRAWLIAHTSVLVVTLPLIPLLRLDMGGEASAPFAVPFQPAAIGYAYYSFLAGFSLGPSLRELHTASAAEAIRAALAWGVPLAAAAAILAWNAVPVIRSRRWAAYLVLLVLLPPIVAVALAGAMSVTFQTRHVLWSALPMTVLLGAGVTRTPRRVPALVAATVLVVASLCAVGYRHLDQRYWNEDARALAAHLDRVGDRATPVLVMPGYMTHVVRYYLGAGWVVDSVDGLHATDSTMARDPVEALVSRVATGDPFWLVYSRPFHADPDRRVRAALDERRLARAEATFAGIVLYGSPAGTRPDGSAASGDTVPSR